MIKLRPYQEKAVTDTGLTIARGAKRVLLVAATGSGKSVLIGGICARALAKNKNHRILILCSSSHILSQNEEKIKSLVPQSTVGIYCAGLNRKDAQAQIVLASRDSLGRNPLVCGVFDGILIDEAHQVATDLESNSTLYAKILNAQSYKWLVGMTGTPWRLNGGRIWGSKKFFECISANIGISVLQKEGFLVPYIFPLLVSKIDTTNVQKASTGDFNLQQLELASTPDEVITDCVNEWRRTGADRKVTLFFCVTRAHAQRTAQKILELTGSSAAYIDGDTTGCKRTDLLNDIRAGKYRAICSVGVLTTGFDAPIIDCIVLMRATLSASLFVQMCGRGLRPYREKDNLLILDMAGNFSRFNNLENPLVREQESATKEKTIDETKEQREVRYSVCSSCASLVADNARFCRYCLEVLKAERQETYTSEKIYAVIKIIIDDYVTRKGEKCKRITYYFSNNVASEYLLIERGGWAQRKYMERCRQLINKRVRAMQAEIEGKLIKQIHSIEYLDGASNVICKPASLQLP